MRILITGGAGFLGFHLAERLLAEGARVTLADLSFDAVPSYLRQSENLVCVEGDILDIGHLNEAFRAGPAEVVVHFATMLTADCEKDPARAADVNCRGTALVFEAAARHNAQRVIFGSSVAVFNDDPHLPWGDDRPYAPSSVYGATKVFCEHLAAIMKRSRSSPDWLGLRFGWVYGPGRVRGWTEIQNVIEGFALEHEVVPYPDYHKVNDWTYIDDAVEAVMACLRSPSSHCVAYNVSGDCRCIDEAVAYLQQRFPNVRAEPYPAELPPVGWQFRSEHIEREAGFSSRISLEEGLYRTVNAFRREHGLPAIPG